VQCAEFLIHFEDIFGLQEDDEFVEDDNNDTGDEPFMPVVEIKRIPLIVREVFLKLKTKVVDNDSMIPMLSHEAAYPSHYLNPPDLTCAVNTTALVGFKQVFNQVKRLPKMSSKRTRKRPMMSIGRQ
jgi:hypothetical protein